MSRLHVAWWLAGGTIEVTLDVEDPDSPAGFAEAQRIDETAKRVLREMLDESLAIGRQA